MKTIGFRHLWCVAALVLGAGCLPSGGGGGGGGLGYPPISTGPPTEAEQRLDDYFRDKFGDGGEPAAADRETDSEVEIIHVGEPPEQRIPVEPDDSFYIGFDYTIRSGNEVDAICIGFGSPDEAWCIPVDHPDVQHAREVEGGSLAVVMDVLWDFCHMTDETCHDVRVYAYLRTDAGTYALPNVHTLVIPCGGCDDGSCQKLLPECRQTMPGPSGNQPPGSQTPGSQPPGNHGDNSSASAAFCRMVDELCNYFARCGVHRREDCSICGAYSTASECIMDDAYECDDMGVDHSYAHEYSQCGEAWKSWRCTGTEYDMLDEEDFPPACRD